MRIGVVCSDLRHPIQPRLQRWCAEMAAGGHDMFFHGSPSEIPPSDLLFLVSCHEVVGADLRARHGATLVLHASALPAGRGWSPLVWQILHGCSVVTVTLLEAADRVDAGPIWHQTSIHIEEHELIDEMNEKLFDAELELMTWAVVNRQNVSPRTQPEDGATYWPRRRPEHSRIDPERSIAEQFDLLRVADPARYPAFFDWRGHRYLIAITKTDGKSQ